MASKYGNRRYGGFDSRKEEARYRELCLLEKAGKIHHLERQVKYELIPSQYKDGRCLYRSVTYRADFVYTEQGKTVVEDVKGFRTPEYVIKKKLMYYIHGILVKET